MPTLRYLKFSDGQTTPTNAFYELIQCFQWLPSSYIYLNPLLWAMKTGCLIWSFAGCFRDQARGRLGRNSRPRGRNFALNGTQGEVEVSLKKKKNLRETHFHSVTTQMQAVVTLSDNLLPLNRVSPSIKWQ